MSADTSSTLTVVGTSDVSDSGLIPNLIQPQFQQAFPQFTFKYVGSATGAAIQSAENGTGGPSALIVHAASLENQFVAGGFSYQNRFGNAIFTNDFVLAGPSGSDPAGVAAGAPHNIAQAFADVASAGNAGRATFLSRGGTTTASGTTVEEHQLWALVSSSGLTPSGVVLCSVSAADGGGRTPIKSSVQATSGQPCPDSGSVSQADAPSWYKINATNQAANVVAANACTTQSTSGPNSCYVLTDRGTFDYLASGTDPAGSVPSLAIVTRENSASAPGGATELVNYFHVYIINPSVSGETVNLTAAQDFVNFLTSPNIQGQLKNYLANTGDPAGPPFVADASPAITASGIPNELAAGKSITVTGTVTNREPGFPPLAGKTVALDQLGGPVPVARASGTTDAAGNYRITFTPTSNGVYQVATGEISQIENSTLSPPYGDILSPAATAAAPMYVRAAVSIGSVKPFLGGATVSGRLAPSTPDSTAKLTILARPQGSKRRFSRVRVVSLAARHSTYSIRVALRSGRWQLEASYQDPAELLGGNSPTRNVSVPSEKLGFGRLTIHNGALTLSGSLATATTTRGAVIRLLARRAATKKFHSVGKTSVRPGRRIFTIKAKLQRGSRWVLQLQFSQRGQKTSVSKSRTIVVH
ncbi:MAG: hypothetical protein JO243_20650 [Solirubrobacterales bacterium]|nr:hypothetical protein [Solirubrobacterales bacterium]